QSGMPESIIQFRTEFGGADSFSRCAVFFCPCRCHAPSLVRSCADLTPKIRRAIADVVGLAGFPFLDRCQTDCREVFYMKEIHILGRWADAALPDPIQRVPPRSIDSGHTEDDGAMMFTQVFLAVHARFGQVERGGFVNPGWRI